jgi:hypothetical protein
LHANGIVDLGKLGVTLRTIRCQQGMLHRRAEANWQ